METINEVTDIVLDKTGTITTGEMKIVEQYGTIKSHNISAALEERVYHPIHESQ